MLKSVQQQHLGKVFLLDSFCADLHAHNQGKNEKRASRQQSGEAA